MKLTNSISNNQGQVFEYWMASCLAMTLLGFVRAYLAMALFFYYFLYHSAFIGFEFYKVCPCREMRNVDLGFVGS